MPIGHLAPPMMRLVEDVVNAHRVVVAIPVDSAECPLANASAPVLVVRVAEDALSVNS